MTILLRVEAMAGSDVYSTAEEAIRLANAFGTAVMFKFNSVDCMACPGDNPDGLANRQQELQSEGGNGYKLARDPGARRRTKPEAVTNSRMKDAADFNASVREALGITEGDSILETIEQMRNRLKAYESGTASDCARAAIKGANFYKDQRDKLLGALGKAIANLEPTSKRFMRAEKHEEAEYRDGHLLYAHLNEVRDGILRTEK